VKCPSCGKNICADEILDALSPEECEALRHHFAVISGHLGGDTTAERGSEYFRAIAAKRKSFKGGRPRAL
jgi:hypothetical protein